MNTIIEKIRAEIERRRHAFNHKAVYRELDELLSFLSDLEKEEKPISAYLEKAAEEYASDEMMSGLAERAFIAGAKWQAEQDQETIELAEDHAYLAGAVNEREKMMKKAVEGEVSAIILHKRGDEIHYAVTYPEGEGPHSITDKVRIIIVKEDTK